ncbi:hypothetical protein SKAU_G00016450 [Synaphobranchus kaupii]|uniref:Uncharacterized protein n=1 Tax=Synaphobranchus kaupii TaxID=118154 RepID=A0A9Q1GCT8_SYNKA|nr:hypothetical protein SKAU_G00016450 [Synaphobranchus kaupii]
MPWSRIQTECTDTVVQETGHVTGLRQCGGGASAVRLIGKEGGGVGVRREAGLRWVCGTADALSIIRSQPQATAAAFGATRTHTAFDNCPATSEPDQT